MVWLIIPGIIALVFYICGIFKLGFMASDAIDDRGSALGLACYLAIVMTGIIGIPVTIGFLVFKAYQ